MSTRRIVLYGVTGSGKSTAAQRISSATELPWYRVDDLAHEPGWVKVAGREQRRRIAEICARNEWILDAAYTTWRDIAFSRADVLIVLDYARWRSLLRLIRRTITRVVRRTEICNGNRESLRAVLSRDSILAWHFRSFARKRALIREWIENSPGPVVHRFERPSELDAWIRDLSQR